MRTDGRRLIIRVADFDRLNQLVLTVGDCHERRIVGCVVEPGSDVTRNRVRGRGRGGKRRSAGSARFFAGSWIWEGTINRQGEEPEDFRWRSDSERSLDGRFLLDRQYDLEAGGKMVHLSLVGWCEEQKTIKGWGFWTPPGSPHEEVVYTKTADGWKITREGLTARYSHRRRFMEIRSRF